MDKRESTAMSEDVKTLPKNMSEVVVQVGDLVLVNVAPFIGSSHRHPDTVPCRVLQVDRPRIRICTDRPYREMDIWIEESWVEAVLEKIDRMSATRPR